MKRARKAWCYTQEELAAELGVSRNTAEMIERRDVRPGDKTIRWIDCVWLLKRTKYKDRMEHTQFYEINIAKRSENPAAHKGVY